jgi:hypothetical protein
MTMASVSTAPGLDLFAAAWIEKWTANGGSVLLAPGGKASIGMPVYDKSRAYTDPPSALPEDIQNRHREYLSARYDGEMRGLLELLELVPGGKDAVKLHVRTFPDHVSTNGSWGVL